MHKIRNMPSRSQVALRVAAVTMLASFSACSHGGEPRHPLTDGEPQVSIRATALAPAAAGLLTTNRAKQGLIRAAEAVPVPDAVALAPASAPVPLAGDFSAPTTSRRPRSAVQRDADAAPFAPEDIPDLGVAEAEQPLHEPARALAVAPAPAPAIGPESASPVEPYMGEEPQHFPYWPVYAGGGIAALSILALALLRQRDRKAAQMKRDAEQARAQELERENAAAREAAARMEQERHATQAAAEAASAQEAAFLAAEQARTQAAVAAAEQEQEQAQGKADLRIEAAHRLFDLLHRAERDVEPFLRLLDAAAPVDATTSAPREVVASWHESMLSTRNRLSEALARHQVPTDMQGVEPASDLPNAMSRLIDHAARMSALMVSQQQDDSAILHWSRLLPGALIQLFWRAQTARYSSTMPQLPKVPDAPAPSAARAPTPAEAPAAHPARTHDKAIQQALRGGQSHAVRT